MMAWSGLLARVEGVSGAIIILKIESRQCQHK